MVADATFVEDVVLRRDPTVGLANEETPCLSGSEVCWLAARFGRRRPWEVASVTRFLPDVLPGSGLHCHRRVTGESAGRLPDVGHADDVDASRSHILGGPHPEVLARAEWRRRKRRRGRGGRCGRRCRGGDPRNNSGRGAVRRRGCRTRTGAERQTGNYGHEDAWSVAPSSCPSGSSGDSRTHYRAGVGLAGRRKMWTGMPEW